MMDYQDLLICFDGVKTRGSNRAMCKCPCHHDKKASLSIDKIGDRILLHCFAGCKSEDILAAVGLTFSDLSNNTKTQTYIDKLEYKKGQPVSAVYKYYDENKNYLYEKIRFHDKDMLIGIYDHSTEYFQYGLNGRPKTLFHLPELIMGIAAGERIFYVEGEKDVLTLESMGLTATTAGSTNDWKSEYAPYFKNADVVILPDNDEPGQTLAEKVAKDLKSIAAKVLIVKTSATPKGDVTDYIQEGHSKEDLLQLIQTAEKEIKNKTKKSSGLSLNMVSMEDIEEKPPEWLIPNYIPKRNITTMAGDGGSGKTTVWCEIAASISAGRPCFLTRESVSDTFQQGSGEKVFCFSAEDSAESILKGRLRENNAILPNILTIDIKDERFQHIRFDSKFLEELIMEHKPALLIFDPLQAFIPPHIRMCDRNAMRSCMRPLISLGEKYDCTSLVIVHSNKQSGLWGRRRMADSADIWDISRSVLMVGETNEKNIRYISHEKSNYGMTAETVLFSIEKEKIVFKSYSDKKDRDFVTEVDYSIRQTPQREEAKAFILDFLKDGIKEVSEMETEARAMGISKTTLRRAKDDMKKDNIIKIYSKGFNPKKWYAELILPEQKD